MLATLQKILRPVRGVFLRNFLNLFFNQFTNILVALLVTPVLYQRLGEASYGLVQLGLSVVLLCSIGVSYGYHLNAPKRLALLEDRSAATGKLLNELIATRLFIALLLAFLLFGAAFFLQSCLSRERVSSLCHCKGFRPHLIFKLHTFP